MRNERDFGYPQVTPENILTDYVYATFFRSMLKENRGHDLVVDDVIDQLLAEIEKVTG